MTPRDPTTPVARTPNYGFEKRRKEQERKAKKEAKARRKAEDGVEGDEVQPGDDPSVLPATDGGADQRPD
jgi:hypothetical protein